MCPVAPLPARLGHSIWYPHLIDLLGVGEELDKESCRNVPGYVAVEGPHTRVVAGVELHGQVSVRAYLEDVSALRVLGPDDCAVPLAFVLVEDVHVKPVEVHRVPGEASATFDQN